MPLYGNRSKNWSVTDKQSTPNQDHITKNRLRPQDKPIHSWYRFVLGYPPHLVREYLDKFEADPARDWVFDPFSGTGTTPVEARLQGFCSLATDANPMTALATRVKLRWELDLGQVQTCLAEIIAIAAQALTGLDICARPRMQQLSLFPDKVDTLIGASNGNYQAITALDLEHLVSPESKKVIPKGFISQKPLARVMALRYAIEKTLRDRADIYEFMALALANTIITDAGNVGFGPEVYRKKPAKEDPDVFGAFVTTVEQMIADLETIKYKYRRPFPQALSARDDARVLNSLQNVPPIGIVITSPPYPNEKDYTRSTRLESVLLGLITSKKELREIKNGLLRSNTRNVYVKDNDDNYIADVPSIIELALSIEAKRLELGKTSGFERMYHRVTRLYFGGMHRHLAALYPKLKPGARLAYVVGDQASYFRIPIYTAKLLADVAVRLGYKVEGIELWRTRWSSAMMQNIDENVLILRR